MIAFGYNSWEMIIILVVVLLLFGHRLPTMARSLGSGITEFKRGLKEGSEKGDPKPPSSGGGSSGGDSASGGGPTHPPA